MKTYSADRAALGVFQASLLLLTVLLCIACGVLLASLPKLMWLLQGIFILLFVAFGWVYLPLYFSRLQCLVTPSQITVRRGFFLRREQSIRLQTVQFVRLLTGPGDGSRGMNFLTLHVYGGRLHILFLSRQDRQELTEFLRKRGVYHAP